MIHVKYDTQSFLNNLVMISWFSHSLIVMHTPPRSNNKENQFLNVNYLFLIFSEPRDDVT